VKTPVSENAPTTETKAVDMVNNNSTSNDCRHIRINKQRTKRRLRQIAVIS